MRLRIDKKRIRLGRATLRLSNGELRIGEAFVAGLWRPLRGFRWRGRRWWIEVGRDEP